MRTLNIREVQTRLSQLVDQAVAGEPFVIAKAGKPLVKVTRLDATDADQIKRLGFLVGQVQVPDDFDRMGAENIEALYGAQR